MPDFQKQNIQWFPGHMAKTRRLIKESLNLVDGVIEIVDARVPNSSSNPELSEIINKKPKIVLLNKCDVADENATKMWISYYKNNNITALPVDCRTGKGLNQFIPACKQVLKNVIEKNEAKGMAGKSLRFMVVGIPNTGKSSFINRMAGKNKTVVADRAGVTRSNQWFNVGNGIELLDTPGVLWPKFDDPTVGDISDFENLEGWEILEMIGRKRGFLIKGGEINYERTANIICDEFRGGKLGRISLELPL